MSGAVHRRRRIRQGLAGALLLTLCGAGARADDALAPGRTFTGFVALDGQQIPLPEGEWLLAGRGYEMVQDLSDVAYGAIESVVLFHAEDGEVTALVVAQHNLIPIEDGWGTATECTRDDLPVVANFDAADGHSFCGFAAAVDTASARGSPAAWRAALLFARQRELGVPHGWLMAGLRLSDRHDVVDVRYYFSAAVRRHRAPEAGAAPSSVVAAAAPPAAQPGYLDKLYFWRTSAPAPEAAKLSPAMVEMSRWLQDMQTLVGLGFDNGLTGMTPMPMPWSNGPRAVPRIVDLRLARLDALHAQHVASDEFYTVRRKGIEDARLELAPERMSTAELTAWKTLVDQITTAAENFVVNFVVLGNLAQTIGLLPLQTTADMVQFSIHEWAWNTYGPSRLREAPTIDFARVGVIKTAP